MKLTVETDSITKNGSQGSKIPPKMSTVRPSAIMGEGMFEKDTVLYAAAELTLPCYV